MRSTAQDDILRHVWSRLDYDLFGDTTMILNICPSNEGGQKILAEELSTDPNRPIEWFTRPETGARYARLSAGPGHIAIEYRGTVSSPRADFFERGELTAATPDTIPLDVLHFIYPSRFCESDQMVRLAFSEFGRYAPGIEQVEAVTDWLRRNIAYLSGTTGPITSALHTATHRVGVCRDFAHLGIALCRALNLPARYVSGYAENIDPPDFHAMMEVWLGGRWVLFDSTRKASSLSFVRIATGRDASDASFAFLFGPAVMTDLRVDCRSSVVRHTTDQPS